MPDKTRWCQSCEWGAYCAPASFSIIAIESRPGGAADPGSLAINVCSGLTFGRKRFTLMPARRVRVAFRHAPASDTCSWAVGETSVPYLLCRIWPGFMSYAHPSASAILIDEFHTRTHQYFLNDSKGLRISSISPYLDIIDCI